MDGKSFCRTILLLALPAAFQQTVNIAVNLMDNVMVGMLGETSLSAVSLAGQYYNLYFNLCYGISGGACVLSAQYMGAGKERMVRQVWKLAMYIAGGTGAVFSLVTWIFPLQIMELYTNDPGIAEAGTGYLKVTALVFIFHGTSLIMVNLLRTVGVTRLGLAVSVVSFAANILFNYMFIFGRFGAPRMEEAGAALGTLLSRILEFFITFAYLFGRKRGFCFSPGDLLGRPDGGLLWVFGKIGFPVIISDGMFTVGDNVLSAILGHMGAAMVSGQAITMTAMRLCTAFVLGLSQASSVMVGQAVGAGNVKEAQLQGKWFCIISAVTGILGGILIWMAGPEIIGVFRLSGESADTAGQMMKAMSLLMVCQSMQAVMGKGVLRGGGDTGFLMLADLIFLWMLSIPIGYGAGLVWGWTPFWVFVCLRLDIIGKTFLCLGRLRKGRWIKNVNI